MSTLGELLVITHPLYDKEFLYGPAATDDTRDCRKVQTQAGEDGGIILPSLQVLLFFIVEKGSVRD